MVKKFLPGTEVHLYIKPYWNYGYWVYDGQYGPTGGKYKDEPETVFQVGIGVGWIRFSVAIISGAQYKILVNYDDGWFLWEHKCTLWGANKNIFTSAGLLKWCVLFSSRDHVATLSIWSKIKTAEYGDQWREWSWNDIYTYYP